MIFLFKCSNFEMQCPDWKLHFTSTSNTCMLWLYDCYITSLQNFLFICTKDIRLLTLFWETW